MSDVDLLSPPDQSAVETAVRVFTDAVRKAYGEKLAGVYLFGSRARGDHKPFSDIDLAIVIDDEDARGLDDRIELSNLAYDVLLDTSAEIQPWIFGKQEWDDPSSSIDSGLLRSIKRDVRQVWPMP